MANEIRLIDANALPYTRVQIFHGMNGDTPLVGGYNAVVMSAAIREAPTIDPESLRQKGRWVHDDHFPSQCSECGMISPGDCELSGFYDSNYCPNCGAKMMEE